MNDNQVKMLINAFDGKK